MTTRLRTLTAFAGAVVTLAALSWTTAAGARTSPVLATYQLAPGFYQVTHGGHAVWAANVDGYENGQVYRIAPDRPHPLKLVRRMPFALGGIAVAFGSIWVSDYYGNAVYRVSRTGHIEARIRTGLQPVWLHAAFGSVWVADHHGAALTRIDPADNSVLATVPVGAPHTFRSGPQDITDDGTDLYVGSSNQQSLQTVDPSTNTANSPDSTDDVFCGQLAAVAGVVWSADGCSNTVYRLSPGGTVQQTIPSAGLSGGVVAVGQVLWLSDDTAFDPDTGVGSHAVLTERNPQTGEVQRTIAIGGDATYITKGFGDLWVYDSFASTIRRVDR